MAAGLLLAGLTPALAADLDAQILRDAGITPVEYGSGWYLRGDIGWDFSTHGNLSYYTDARYDFQDQAFGEGVDYSVGFGYVFNDWLRTDLTLDYSGNMDWNGDTIATTCTGFTGDCYQADSASYDRYSLHANAYLNLGRWHGLSPYVGAGVGLSHVTWNNYASVETCALDPGEDCALGSHSGSAVTEYLTGTTTSYPSNSSTMLSYSLMGGFDYRLDERWSLDVGYKWTRLHDLTVVPTNAGGAGSPAGATRADQLDIHEVRLGLRYEIW